MHKPSLYGVAGALVCLAAILAVLFTARHAWAAVAVGGAVGGN
ncbi:MAG: hypothetical protein ABI399_05340 [Bauldia sp.]